MQKFNDETIASNNKSRSRKEQKLKIIYLHQYFNTPAMPGGLRSYEMARRLVAYGHEVHVVTSDRNCMTVGKGWTTTHEEGVNIHWLSIPYHNTMSYAKRLLAFTRFALAAALKAHQIGGDVVLATSTPLTIAIPGVYASRRNRLPMIFEVRDLWPELPIAIGAISHPLTIGVARWMERLAYRHSARVVALSPGMADGVAACGYPRCRIAIIPNSCDLDVFMPSVELASQFRLKHPELGDAPFVLYAGALGRMNGVGYLVDVAEHCRERLPDLRFVIMGEGVETDRVRDKAVEKGLLGTSVFLYPRVAHAEIPHAFAAASVVTSLFVDITCMQRNSANKFFDGLASGTGVAINYEGWQADLLRETGAGFVLSRDPGIAARQLEQWLGDEEGLKNAGLAARRLAVEKFSRDELAARLEATLLSAMEGGSQSPQPTIESGLS